MVFVFPIHHIVFYIPEVFRHAGNEYFFLFFEKEFLQYDHTRVHLSVAIYDELAIEKRNLVLYLLIYKTDIELSRAHFRLYARKGFFETQKPLSSPPDVVDREEIYVLSSEGMRYEAEVFFQMFGSIVLDNDIDLMIDVVRSHFYDILVGLHGFVDGYPSALGMAHHIAIAAHDQFHAMIFRKMKHPVIEKQEIRIDSEGELIGSLPEMGDDLFYDVECQKRLSSEKSQIEILQMGRQEKGLVVKIGHIEISKIPIFEIFPIYSAIITGIRVARPRGNKNHFLLNYNL